MTEEFKEEQIIIPMPQKPKLKWLNSKLKTVTEPFQTEAMRLKDLFKEKFGSYV